MDRIWVYYRQVKAILCVCIERAGDDVENPMGNGRAFGILMPFCMQYWTYCGQVCVRTVWRTRWQRSVVKSNRGMGGGRSRWFRCGFRGRGRGWCWWGWGPRPPGLLGDRKPSICWEVLGILYRAGSPNDLLTPPALACSLLLFTLKSDKILITFGAQQKRQRSGCCCWGRKPIRNL